MKLLHFAFFRWLLKIEPREFGFVPSFFDNVERCQVRAASVARLGQQAQILNCAGICRGGGSVVA